MDFRPLHGCFCGMRLSLFKRNDIHFLHELKQLQLINAPLHFWDVWTFRFLSVLRSFYVSILFDTINKSMTYTLSRPNNSYVSVTNCRETLRAWGVPAPSWVLMCMIGYNVDNVMILGFWCHWIETVSDLPPPPIIIISPPFSFCSDYFACSRGSHRLTQTQLTTRTVEQQPWVTGSWAFFFFFLPSTCKFLICQKKELIGFTHRVYF